MGEGAAVLVLEELEHARARGAKVYAELAGYGVSSDSFHMTEPDPLGAGQARAVEAALADAALDPDRRRLRQRPRKLNGARRRDRDARTQAGVGRGHVQTIPVSATKGATGHCLGAAGAVEAAFTVLAVNRDVVPPTINYQTPDPACHSTASLTKHGSYPSVSRSATASALAVTTLCSSCASLLTALNCGTHRPEVGRPECRALRPLSFHPG